MGLFQRHDLHKFNVASVCRLVNEYNMMFAKVLFPLRNIEPLPMGTLKKDYYFQIIHLTLSNSYHNKNGACSEARFWH